MIDEHISTLRVQHEGARTTVALYLTDDVLEQLRVRADGPVPVTVHIDPRVLPRGRFVAVEMHFAAEVICSRGRSPGLIATPTPVAGSQVA